MAPKSKRAHESPEQKGLQRSKSRLFEQLPALHDGPSSLQELYRWPQTVLQRLFQRGDGQDDLRKVRLQTLLSRDVYVYSDYSGLAGEYEAFHQMTAALNEFFQPQKKIAFQHTRACDFGDVQQTVLRYISMLESGSMCVMRDLNDRLCSEARNHLDALMPPKNAPAEEASSAYAAMSAFLLENRAWAYSQDGKSHCMVHNKRCPLLPEIANSAETLGDAAGAAPRQPGREQLLISLAGTTCKGWSSVGKKKYFADVSERPHAVWLGHRMVAAERSCGPCEDIFFSECTTRYPAQARLCCACFIFRVEVVSC